MYWIKNLIPGVILVQKAAELVRSAKNPVCLLGSQSTLPPTSTTDIAEALEVNKIYQNIFHFVLRFYRQWTFHVFLVVCHEVYWVEIVQYNFVIVEKMHSKMPMLFF